MLSARAGACAIAVAASACTAYDREHYAQLVDGAIDRTVVDQGVVSPDSGPDADVPALDARMDTDVPVAQDTPTLPDSVTDAGPMCPARSVTDYCAQFPALPFQPVIDGTLDCGLHLEPLSPDRNWSNATPPPQSLGIEFATAWRSNGFYAFVHVTTPRRVPAPVDYYCGDAVELFFDSDGVFASQTAYDHPGTRQFIVAAPAGSASTHVASVWSMGYLSEWASTSFIAKPTSDGYDVEAFVTAADLGLASLGLTAAAHVGFDLMVDFSPLADVDAGHCPALGQAALNVGSPRATCGDGRAECNPAAFCTPVLDAP